MFDWQFAAEILPSLLQALGVTVQATILGMSLSVILGLIWALARRSPSTIISGSSLWIVEFLRSTPLLVQLYFLFYVLPQWGLSLTPLQTGIFGLGLHYSAYTAEVYRAGIESLPKGQWEAALALNMGFFQTWKNIILPQALPPIIPAMGNYLVAMFKDTPLLSAITTMELLQTAKLVGAETFRYLEPFTIVGLLFLTLSLTASWGIKKIEKKYVCY